MYMCTRACRCCGVYRGIGLIVCFAKKKRGGRACFVAWDTVRVEGGNSYKCAGFRRALVCARRRAAIYHLAHEGVGR